MYITDTLSSVREFREGAERKRIQQKHLKTRLKGQSPAVHFLKIHFTEAQIAAIAIPPSITCIQQEIRYKPLCNFSGG